MLDSDNSESLNAARRRKPTPEEEARLRADWGGDADRQGDWEDARRLDHLLRHLPDAPISSNFTARVLSQIERETRAKAQHPWLAKWQSLADSFPAFAWAPRLAVGAIALSISLLCVYQYRLSARAEIARSVAAVSNVAALPSWDVLMNFEAIQRLPQIPKNGKVDAELLAALK